MNEKVIIIGGGGHAAVVIDALTASGDIPCGILDARASEMTDVLGVPITGTPEEWKKYKEYKFIVAIGNNKTRKLIVESMPGAAWHTVIHPSATVSAHASIGKGTVILAGATVNARATVGDHCIINTRSIVEHDNVISDYVHLSPASVLSGSVSVGELTHIGTGVSTTNNVSICSGCTLGVATAVIRDITVPGVYIGIPARRIK